MTNQDQELINDDTHSDYQTAKSRAEAAMRRGVWTDRFQPRYVPFSRREMRCDIPREVIARLSEGKHHMSYRGLPLAKDPFDMVTYATLFYELQPATIIELGAYTGASALWMKDTLDACDLSTQVISVDLDLSLIAPMALERQGITFVQGDCNQIDEIFPISTLRDVAHPLILIDDAHVNIPGVYQHFHDHGLHTGDYLIVEDTIPWIPGSFGDADDDSEWGDWKWQEIQQFFQRHESDYHVDRYYCDFFGYNATWNWNGFVKRI